MIVLCPSCSTRYRHEPAGPQAVLDLECSRCDERFAAQPARRSYVILPPRGANGRTVERAAGPAQPAQVRIAIPAAAPMAEPPRARVTGDPAGPRELLSEPILASGAAPNLPEAAPPRPRSAVAEFVVAVVPPAVGASAAYYVAVRAELDPVAWSALGGAVGFLLGWGCLLWIRRKD